VTKNFGIFQKKAIAEIFMPVKQRANWILEDCLSTECDYRTEEACEVMWQKNLNRVKKCDSRFW
jgi:hypothetical protein